MAVNSLGSFTFRFWRGPPPPQIQQSVQVLTHPGVDYEGYRWLGKRSGPISRESIVDVASITAGRALFNSYVGAIETGPHKIVWFDYDFDAEAVRAVVTSVELVSLQKKVVICGALTDGHTWDLVARWNMRLTPYSP